MGPNNLAHSVSNPRPAGSGATPKIVRVLMEEAGIDGLRHRVADRKVAIRRAKVLAITRCTLAKRPIGIR
jgi:hypothetical protein